MTTWKPSAATTNFSSLAAFLRNDLGHRHDQLQPSACSCHFTASQRSPLRDTTSYLWPLGFTYTEDREKKYREWGAPWPLIAFARGEGKTLNRVWPFFSHGQDANVSKRFLPLAGLQVQPDHLRPAGPQRTRFLFFLYSDLASGTRSAARPCTGGTCGRFSLRAATTTATSGSKFWRRSNRFCLRNRASNATYSPFWSVWRSERNAQDRGRPASRCSGTCIAVTPRQSTRKCSLLFGLFHYQSGPEGKRWRLFYVPFGNEAKQRRTPAGQSSKRLCSKTSVR